MKINIYQVDAFTSEVFSGNPAAVCPLEYWLSDEILQNIAMENNLAETAFYVKDIDKFNIRWFTPSVEVDLCGHATLAAAHVIFNFENHSSNSISFYSDRSGALEVSKSGSLLTLNFPTDLINQIELDNDLSSCFNIIPQVAFKGRTDYMLVFSSEEEIHQILPNMDKIAQLTARGVIITAPGNEVDFVTRFFAPQSGIDEDPVTGSAFTSLLPYWHERLGKIDLTAIQLSKRRGYIKGRFLDTRVEISGEAKLYMRGEIIL